MSPGSLFEELDDPGGPSAEELVAINCRRAARGLAGLSLEGFRRRAALLEVYTHDDDPATRTKARREIEELDHPVLTRKARAAQAGYQAHRREIRAALEAPARDPGGARGAGARGR